MSGQRWGWGGNLYQLREEATGGRGEGCTGELWACPETGPSLASTLPSLSRSFFIDTVLRQSVPTHPRGCTRRATQDSHSLCLTPAGAPPRDERGLPLGSCSGSCVSGFPVCFWVRPARELTGTPPAPSLLCPQPSA